MSCDGTKHHRQGSIPRYVRESQPENRKYVFTKQKRSKALVDDFSSTIDDLLNTARAMEYYGDTTRSQV